MKYIETMDEIGRLVEAVEAGEEDALTVYAEIKRLAGFVAEALTQLEPYAISEAEKYDKPTFDYCGFTFTRNNGRTVYNFKNVPQWAETKARLAKIEELSKQASKMSVLTGGGHVVDEDGQIIEPCETTISKPSLSVKQK
jgi:hypothetical protein